MSIMMENKLYHECWNILKEEYNNEFRKFMEKEVI